MVGHGGDGETQALDGGTPPLGSPFSNGDATQSEGGNGVMYWETQALDEAETQVVDDGLEEEEGVAGDWAETQLVEDCEEEDDSGVAEQVKTQMVEDCEEDGYGANEQEKTHAVAECEKKEYDGVMEDNASDWARTQLVEGCEVEDGGNDGVGDMVETQLVGECQEVDERGECQEEDERGNGSGDEDVGEWGMTQLVEDTDEELGDDGLSEGTQVLSDNEGLSNDVRDVKLGMGGSNGEMNGAVLKHDNTKNLVDSDASTDEEGDTVRTCELAAARDAFTVNSVQQGKRQASTNETHLLTKIIDKSTSCSTSFGDRPVCGIDDDSHGYVQNHDKDGTKSRGRCLTAKKLFADTMAEEGENKNRCIAGLSYIESQEPGDLSQANALEVVDRLISINGSVSSQEPTPNKLDTAKLPVSSKRGTLMFAEKVDRSKSSNGRAEIFAWVDSREDDGGGDFFSKNKNILLRTSAGRGRSKSQFPRAKKCSTKIAPGENKIGECKNRINSELCERFETIPLPDARLLKSDAKSKRSSGKRTKKNLLKDLDDLLDAKYLGEQQEKVSVSSHDVGPDTQMALEAIEALAQCSPAKILSAKGEPPLEREMRDEKSKLARSHSKNGPPQKRTRGIQEGVSARSKRRKVTVLNPKPQKERQRRPKMQENSKDLRAKAKHKEAKSVPEKSKVSEISLDGNKYHGTPIAHCTRHSRKNNLFEYTELCSNKHLKRGMNLTGYSSTIVEVQNNNEPELRMISERTTDSDLNYVEKQSTEYTCANNAQHLQQCRDENTQHTSADIAQNLEPCRGEPTTDVTCREPSSHPKQRRTPTAMVQSRAPTVTQTATDHEITPEVARQTKKRRVFIRSASDLLKYAKREPSNGRSTSMLSSIIAKSSAASPIPNSSVRVDSKTSGFSSPGQRQKEPSNVDNASKSPKSNSQVQNSALKTPSKVVNELSPTFSPLNPSKASSRSLSKSSVARELLKLDHQNALSNRQLKDSRRRKDVTSYSILFSHHLDEDVIKCQKKILTRLGVCEVFAMSDATHFVADSFFRTKNMLEAIALGKLVVTSMWLENCGPAGCFIDEKKYILRDAKKEKEIGFSMPISLASACKHPLLLGKRVFVTLNVKPSREVVTSLVLASSGQPLERIGRSIMKGKEVPDDLLIISCEEDSETVEPLLERGASVFNSELVLNGIIIQKLEYERHRLFSDRVRQTRSTRWLKDAAHGRPYLLRDAYDDMILDGVQPVRDTFHNLIVGTMKGSRLQDAFYFRDQMREMGLQPDVNLYNFLISMCGKCKNSDAAIMLLEEMKAHGIKLKGETYICLLNALAATGRTDQVYAIVRDMTAAGLGLNKFCYAGLITAFKNKTPTTEETLTKILEFVQQSKGWQYVERVSKDSAENIMMNVSEEELYNLPTAEYAHRRVFVFKQLTVYHVAIHACADLQSKETLEALLDMVNKDGFTYDAFIVMQAMRCYLRCGDIDSAIKMFEEFASSKSPPAELYVTLAEGAMIGHTPRGMQLAQETIEKMTSRNFFLNPRMGTDLLLAASGERTGGYTTANYVWDLLQNRNIIPSLPAVEAYHKGLKEREIPSDDPRLVHVSRVLDNLSIRFGPRRNTPSNAQT